MKSYAVIIQINGVSGKISKECKFETLEVKARTNKNAIDFAKDLAVMAYMKENVTKSDVKCVDAYVVD